MYGFAYSVLRYVLYLPHTSDAQPSFINVQRLFTIITSLVSTYLLQLCFTKWSIIICVEWRGGGGLIAAHKYINKHLYLPKTTLYFVVDHHQLNCCALLIVVLPFLFKKPNIDIKYFNQ